MEYEPNYNSRQIMNASMEKELAQYLATCSTMNYGLTFPDARKFSFELAVANSLKIPPNWIKNSMAGKDWMSSFIKRHHLSLRKPEPCSLARNTSFNQHNVNEFMKNLQTVFEREPSLAVEPNRIYNLDETAVTTVCSPPRIIAAKGTHQVNKVTSTERGEMTTLCCMVNASGNFLPPAMIFPRVNFKDEFVKDAPPSTLGLAAKSPWMTGLLFVKVLEHFVKYAKCTKEEKALLILDNHASHLHPNVIEFAIDNGVILLTLPPHCSHRMQPLDVSVFGPFNTYYASAMESFHMHYPGVFVKLKDIGKFVNEAFNRSMTPSNIQSGFRKPGIYPFNKHAFSDADFAPSAITEKEDPTKDNNASLETQLTIDLPTTSATSEPSTSTGIYHEAGPKQLPQASEGTKVRPNDASNSHSTISGGTSHKADSIRYVSPEMIRSYPKKAADEGNQKRKRKAKKSIIATDPNVEQLPAPTVAATNKAGSKPKKKKSGQLATEDDEDRTSDEDIAEVIDKLDDSDDEYDEETDGVGRDVIIVELGVVKQVAEGDHVIVEYETTADAVVYYVAKVLDVRSNECVSISCLRRVMSDTYKFGMPVVPDINEVKLNQLRYILPTPASHGGTQRQQSVYQFDCFFPTNINIR